MLINDLKIGDRIKYKVRENFNIGGSNDFIRMGIIKRMLDNEIDIQIPNFAGSNIRVNEKDIISKLIPKIQEYDEIPIEHPFITAELCQAWCKECGKLVGSTSGIGSIYYIICLACEEKEIKKQNPPKSIKFDSFIITARSLNSDSSSINSNILSGWADNDVKVTIESRFINNFNWADPNKKYAIEIKEKI